MHKTKVYLYCLFDKVSAQTLFYNVSENDSRALLKIIQTPTMRIPLSQCEVLRLGELLTSVPEAKPDTFTLLDFKDVLSFEFYRKPKSISWSEIRLPENSVEALAPLGLSVSEVEELVKREQQNMNIVR